MSSLRRDCIVVMAVLLTSSQEVTLAFAQQRTETSPPPKERLHLEMLVPPDLPPIRFGDPVYVPLAIRNTGDLPQRAPSFQSHMPYFTFTVNCGRESNVSANYAVGPGGDARTFPPGSIETTVILANIWSPGVALEFLDTAKATISFTASVREPYDPNPPAPEEQLTASTRIHLLGGPDSPFDPESAFDSSSHKRLYELARRVFSPEFRDSNANGLDAGNAFSTAFTKGQSPLSWFDFNEDNTDSWHENSEYYRKTKAMVSRESSLYRMMTFIELRNELRGTNEKHIRTSSEVLDVYAELLDECHPAERHFNIAALNVVGSLTAFPNAVREPDMTWPDLCAELRQRFPLYSMYFTGSRYDTPYASLSLIGHSVEASQDAVEK